MLDRLKKVRIVPVVALEKLEHALPMAEALLAGDTDVVEITFRSTIADKVIYDIKNQFPSMLVAAGTVINIENAKKAIDSGADLLVSPGFNTKVVEYCLDKKVTLCPGVETASEIERALDYGFSFLKFFPAEESGGIRKLKAFGAPYPNVLFMPTGGVNLENYKDYLACKNVMCCGGSFLVKKEFLDLGNYYLITEQCKKISR